MIALSKILVDQRTPILIQHGRKRAQVFPQAHGGNGVAYEVEAFGGGVLWHLENYVSTQSLVRMM